MLFLRKMVKPKTRFYAYVSDDKHGVVNNWEQCRENTTGKKGAKFKGFATMEGATDFVRNLIIWPIRTAKLNKCTNGQIAALHNIRAVIVWVT